MKTLRLLLFLSALLALAGLGTVVRAAETANFRGILIAGSNEEGQTDRRLAPYEGNLKRMLPFKSYRFLGEGSASVPVPGRGAMNLGRGHRLELSTDAAGERVRVEVSWPAANLNTGLSLRPGAHTVLGGASGENN
ncbi:MAG TPA: hypothetical protein VEB66_18405, partial [Opitutaceae bacterium]|nr:hypothetical protein [Opitutaceae bacterium]